MDWQRLFRAGLDWKAGSAWVRSLFAAPDTKLHCPYCGGTEWDEGPGGGMSVNIMCLNPACEHWFNYHQEIIPMDDLHMVGVDRRPAH
jgi:hypothetical protein